METGNNIEFQDESNELNIIEERMKERESDISAAVETGKTQEDIKKEILRDIIRERMREFDVEEKKSSSSKIFPPDAASFPAPINKSSRQQHSSLKTREYEEKLRQLVVVAFEKSIPDAVSEALKLSPYYIDALHDSLVDKFFNELNRLGKI